MVENNPISLLLSQYHELYPLSSACQFLLNIGSGSKPVESKDTNVHEYGGIMGSLFGAHKTSALHRIASAYEWLLSGLSYWEKYTRSIGESSKLRSRCVRLDAALVDVEPKLDDVRAVPKLKERVRNDTELSAAIQSMAERIIASMFYFQLGELPVQEGAMFRGVGPILCLRKSGDPALPLVIEKLVAWNARFVVNNRVMNGNMLSPCFWDAGGNFSMPAQFQVVGQELSVSLRWPDGRAYPISGSPYFIRKMVRKQGLDAHFGIPDHRRSHRASHRIHSAVLREGKDDRKVILKRTPTDLPIENSCKRRRLWWGVREPPTAR